VRISPSSHIRYTIIVDGMHQPLPEVYPEYCVVEHAQGGREFRVESKGYFQSQRAPARNYTGLIDYVLALIVPTLGAVAWQMVCYTPGMLMGLSTETSLSLIAGP
jgi:hypothetical protein